MMTSDSTSDEVRLHVLLSDICDRHLPTEKPILHAVGGDLIRRVVANDRSERLGRGEFEFGASASVAIDIVGVAWTAYEIIKEIRSHMRAQHGKSSMLSDVKEIAEQWRAKLERQGLPPEKATLIADDFALDIVTMAREDADA